MLDSLAPSTLSKSLCEDTLAILGRECPTWLNHILKCETWSEVINSEIEDKDADEYLDFSRYQYCMVGESQKYNPAYAYNAQTDLDERLMHLSEELYISANAMYAVEDSILEEDRAKLSAHYTAFRTNLATLAILV